MTDANDRSIDDATRAAAATLLPIARRIDQRPGLASFLRGEWIGHPLHPVLTDLPIGFWTSAWVLDFVPGQRDAARKLIGLGVLSAVPTALAGAADWTQADRRRDRLTVLHIAANSTATMLYAFSWWQRRRGRHLRGVATAQIAAAAATVGGYLGGELAFGASPPEPDTHEPRAD
jgi:uncharacterized membrane protein